MEIPRFEASRDNPLLKDLYKHSEYLRRHLPLSRTYFMLFTSILEPKMPQDYLEYLGMGAKLHDVGKKVALGLLEKPEYTLEERRLVETHPKEGARLLTRLYGREHPYTIMAAFHHEHWSGHGYPNRLRGDEIPEYARIMTIADIFSTVTQPRPYNAKVYTPIEALGLLEEEAGKIFDPNLIKPLVQRLQYEFT